MREDIIAIASGQVTDAIFTDAQRDTTLYEWLYFCYLMITITTVACVLHWKNKVVDTTHVVLGIVIVYVAPAFIMQLTGALKFHK